MPTTFTSRMEVQLTASTWTDLGTDVLVPITARYGIDGNGPADSIASSGELAFDLDNSAQNSGATLGYYSPIHASVRSGWTFGIQIRCVIHY